MGSRSGERWTLARRAIALALFVAAPFALAMGMPPPAAAQAPVQIEVSGGEAEVTLAAEQGSETFRCRTQSGRCQIARVTAGAYIVTATPIGPGRAPLPRRVMIAGTGTVTVHVRLLD
ncbi:MAG: hypothetical protein AB7S26_23720 [Sandaracinaceae bacterium]